MFKRLFSKFSEDKTKKLTKVENHSLYHYGSCPFCFKVRICITRLGIEIPMMDIQKSTAHRDTLKAGGGNTMVPCLRIEENGQDRWMYESGDIVAYLEERFSSQSH